jgi:hypothetical protein
LLLVVDLLNCCQVEVSLRAGKLFTFQQVFSSSQFWYYNHEVYPELNTLAVGMPMVDVIHNRNVVIPLATEHNIHHAGWGFVYRALDELKTVSN